MILKYRTTSLNSPPHTSFSYIDNISYFSPSYNPQTSTLTVNLTLRTPIYTFPNSPLYSVPTSLVLNDLAILLTDEGKFLDKVFDPNSSYQQKPYKPYNRPYYKKPYYKNQQYRANQNSYEDMSENSEDSEENVSDDSVEE